MTNKLESSLLQLKEQLGNCERIPAEVYSTLQQALWACAKINMQLEEFEHLMEVSGLLQQQSILQADTYKNRILELEQQIFDEGAARS